MVGYSRHTLYRDRGVAMLSHQGRISKMLAFAEQLLERVKTSHFLNIVFHALQYDPDTSVLQTPGYNTHTHIYTTHALIHTELFCSKFRLDCNVFSGEGISLQDTCQQTRRGQENRGPGSWHSHARCSPPHQHWGRVFQRGVRVV